MARPLPPLLGRYGGSPRDPVWSPGPSGRGGAAKIGRERRAPEAVKQAARTRGFRASSLWGSPASPSRPTPSRPSPHSPHPAWSPPHLTSFILAAPSPFQSKSTQNRKTERRPATNMNGRKHSQGSDVKTARTTADARRKRRDHPWATRFRPWGAPLRPLAAGGVPCNCWGGLGLLQEETSGKREIWGD